MAELPKLPRDQSLQQGLMTAAASGAVFGGPIGALLGLGAGLLSRSVRNSELDYLVAEADQADAMFGIASSALERVAPFAVTDFDKSTLASLQESMGMLQQGMLSPSPEMREQAAAGAMAFSDVVMNQVQRIESGFNERQGREIGTLQKLSDLAGTEYQTALGGAREAQKASEAMNTMLSDPDFDPNSPQNRGMLANQLGMMTRGLVIDPTDFGDVLASAGAGIPLVQQWTAYQSMKMDAADFNWSREDWRKIGAATLVAARNQADAAFQQAEQTGAMLDEGAGRIGYTPVLAFRDQIIRGKVQDTEGLPGPGGYSGIESGGPTGVTDLMTPGTGTRQPGEPARGAPGVDRPAEGQSGTQWELERFGKLMDSVRQKASEKVDDAGQWFQDLRARGAERQRRREKYTPRRVNP